MADLQVGWHTVAVHCFQTRSSGRLACCKDEVGTTVVVLDAPQHDGLLLTGQPVGVHLLQPHWQLRGPLAARCTASWLSSAKVRKIGEVGQNIRVGTRIEMTSANVEVG